MCLRPAIHQIKIAKYIFQWVWLLQIIKCVFIDGKMFALLGLNINVKGVFISLWQDFLLQRKTSVGILTVSVPASVFDFKYSSCKVCSLEFLY